LIYINKKKRSIGAGRPMNYKQTIILLAVVVWLCSDATIKRKSFLKAVENLVFFEHSFIIGKKSLTLPTQMLTILEYNRIKN